jgi:hypothetical protein
MTGILVLGGASEPLTYSQRAAMASDIIENMRADYAKHGEEDCGDWADGERHLRDDANTSELLAELAKWCSEKKVSDYL